MGEAALEAWTTEAGVCIAPKALAMAAGLQVKDVEAMVLDWSKATRSHCVYVADGMGLRLTVPGVELALSLLANDQGRADHIQERLRMIEKRWRAMR